MKHTLTRHLLVPLLISGCLLNSCHSPVYYASERGDLNAVKKHIQRGDNLSGKEPTGLSDLLFVLPVGLAALSVDICLGIITLGAYGKNKKTISGAIFTAHERTAAEAALKNGHIDIVGHLLANNAKAPAYVREYMEQNHAYSEANGRATWYTQRVAPAAEVQPAPEPAPTPRKSKPKRKPTPAPKPANSTPSSASIELPTGRDLSTPGR